jgi:hypothetical protein
MTECRPQIIRTFAAWTVLSALRSGAPIKSRETIYPLLAAIRFKSMFVGSRDVTGKEFDAWHRAETLALCERAGRLSIGWGAKMINVYLKTAAYVGGLGRPGLADAVHPPVDGGLWKGLRHRFAAQPGLLARTHCAQRIRDIRDYETYATIIDGCREAAGLLGCRLIEVEQLWEGAAPPPGRT